MKKIIVAILLVTMALFALASCGGEELPNYTVTFDTDGGTTVAAQTVEEGQVAIKPADPTKEGFTFAGWFVGETAYDFSSAVTANLTVKAKWTQNTYTVIFDTDGAAAIDAETVAYGATATKPADPIKEGFTFMGWFVGDAAYDFTAPVKANVEIKAKWAEITYTVTFDTDGAEAIEAQTVAFGGTATKPQDPTKEGFTFAGWTVNGEAYDFATVLTADVTIKATWAEITYTVTFDTDNGAEATTETVKFGGTATKPADPTKEGYTFVGWTVNGEAYDFATVLTADVTIKATWAEIAYTVTFDTDGAAAIEAQTVAFGGTATKPADPTKEGFTFAGWTVNGEAYDFATVLTADVTIKATWAEITYTVTFDTDNGAEATTETVKFGGTATKPADPTKDGFTFAGWTVNGEAYDFATVLTADVTIKATWAEITYTVTFDTDNGAEATTETVKFGGTATKPADPTKDGFYFMGWTVNGEAYDFATVLTGDITVKAEWLAKPDLTAIAGKWTGTETDGLYTNNEYTFIINADATITASYENSYTTVNMAVNTVAFDGTTLTINYNNGDQIVFKLKDGKLAAEKAVAGYALTIEKTYTVTYDKDGSLKTYEVKHGELVTAYNPTKTGYDLEGWYLDGVKFDTTTTPITSDLTLIAQWKVKMIKVTFLNQDGSVAKEIEVEYNTPFTDIEAPATITTTEGYKFNGKWYGSATTTSPVSKTAKISSEKTYYPGIIAPMGDIAGTWKGTDTKDNTEYTFVINAETQTVAVTTVAGETVTELNVTTIYYKDATKLVVKYLMEGATSETTLNLTKQDDGTFKISSTLSIAKEGVKTFTVTFDSAEGTAVDAQTVADGAIATEPTAPTKDGFTFDGWYNGEDKYDFTTPVTADITLTAKWVVKAVEYTVTFDSNGGSAVDAQTVAEGGFATEPTSTKKYYVIEGWYIGDVKYDFSTPVTADITLKAKWVGEPKTFTFCNQDGSVIKTVTVPYGETVPASEIPTTAGVNEGFVFTGIWVKGTKWLVTSAKFNFETEQIKNDTTKVFPAVVATSIKELAGTWTGTYVGYSSTDDYVINIAVDENYKVTITGTYTSSKTGTSEIILQSVQFDGSKMTIKYFRGEAATSASTLTVTLQEDGTLKATSGPTLTKG